MNFTCVDHGMAWPVRCVRLTVYGIFAAVQDTLFWNLHSLCYGILVVTSLLLMYLGVLTALCRCQLDAAVGTVRVPVVETVFANNEKAEGKLFFQCNGVKSCWCDILFINVF